MSEKTMDFTEREEIEMLVPFYVTGRISEADARRIEDYLKRNPDFAEHIALAREEHAGTVAVNEALGFPSARATDRIFEAIAKEPQPLANRARAEGRGLLAAMREFFTAPTASAVRYAAIAAAAVVLLQAAILGTMMTRTGGPDGGGFEVAGGPGETAGKTAAALVAFRDGAALADVTRVLNEVGASIVEGPAQGGFYKVRFAGIQPGTPALEKKVEALKSQTAIVKSVLPSR